MPLLAALLEALLSKLFLLLGLMFAKRVALAISGVVALTAISGALYATMRSVLIPLAGSLFSTSFGGILGMAFPPIAGNCIYAIATVWSACGLYAWQRTAIQRITSI